MTSCDEPEKVSGKPQNLFYEGFLGIEDLPLNQKKWEDVFFEREQDIPSL